MSDGQLRCTEFTIGDTPVMAPYWMGRAGTIGEVRQGHGILSTRAGMHEADQASERRRARGNCTIRDAASAPANFG
jgi:hypothetical protein